MYTSLDSWKGQRVLEWNLQVNREQKPESSCDSRIGLVWSEHGSQFFRTVTRVSVLKFLKKIEPIRTVHNPKKNYNIGNGQ